MPTFERPAVEIQQGNLILYLTYVTPTDLFENGFYSVDKLEPKTNDGYQRILNATRANRLSRHLAEALEKGYANIPTSIFLATSRLIDFDIASGLIHFETEDVCPFSVVDGQHRIEGLKRALQDKDTPLWNFKLPATIAVNLDDTHQMYHFYIVNTTQKPVEKDLAQQITRRFTDMRGIEQLPYLPHWLRRQVDQGTDAKSLKMIEFLNETPESPLRSRVKMANDATKRGNRVTQGSLVTLFKEHILSGTNPITSESDLDRQCRIVLNYFRAVDQIFVANIKADDTVVWLNNGLFFFLLISKWVFSSIYASTRDFTVGSISKTLRDALSELDDDYQVIAHPEWWQRGAGGASGMNRGAARLYGNGFLAALNRSQTGEIKL